MMVRFSLALLILSVLFVQSFGDGSDNEKQKEPGKKTLPKSPSELSEKAKEYLMNGQIDKLSEDERKKLKPKDIADIVLTKVTEEVLKNLTKIIGMGGRKDVEKYANKLNCSQLRQVLNESSKWDCERLIGLVPKVEKCRMSHSRKNMSEANFKAMAGCGLLKNLDKKDYKTLAKEGAFRDASKEVKKEQAKKVKEYFGKPEQWGKDDIEAMEDFIEFISIKDLLKIQRQLFKDSKDTLKKLPKQKKSDLFRQFFKGRQNLTVENITWVCEAGFQAELRPNDIKHLPKTELKSKAECFGSDKAHTSVRKEFTKRLCSNAMDFDSEIAKACIHSVQDMRPSVLKNSTVARRLLDEYLNLSDKMKPKVMGEICRALAKAFMMKYNSNNSGMDPGPLIKCTNEKSAEEIIKNDAILKNFEKSKKKKGLRREVLEKLLKKPLQNAKKLISFANEMNIDELKSLDVENYFKEDEEGILTEDKNEGACSDDDDSNDDDDDSSDDESSDDEGDDDENPKFCGKSRQFILLKTLGKVSDHTVLKVKQITKLLLNGGLTEKDILDLNEQEYSTLVAILGKRANVFTVRQCSHLVRRYRKLNMDSARDQINDMKTMIACLNKTVLESFLPDHCDDVIMSLRNSGFMWRLAPKARMDRVKIVFSKCVNADINKMTGDQLVNLGHLVSWLEPGEFEKIPGQLFVDNLRELRDNLQEQTQQKRLAYLIRNITARIINHKGGPSALNAEDTGEFGVLLKGLTVEQIKGIKNPDTLEELQVHEEYLNEKAAEQLLKSRQGRVVSRRRRDTSDYSALDADYFLLLGRTILGIPANEITNIQNSVFEDIVGTVSEISGWTDEQLRKWAEKAITVWGSVESFTTSELLLLNNFAKGFTAAELNKMNFGSDDVIDSFGSIPDFATEQVEQIFAKIKASNAVSAMSGADLLQLGYIALGMTAADIRAIRTEAFKVALSQFGGMTGWSYDQLLALKEETVTAYGATSTWEGGLLSTANVIIGGFSDSEIEGLTSDDLQYISSEAIQSLHPNKFKLISADLLSQLDSEQAASVTSAQIEQLSESQKNALASLDVNVGSEENEDDKDNKNGDNSATVNVIGLTALLLPVIISQHLI